MMTLALPTYALWMRDLKHFGRQPGEAISHKALARRDSPDQADYVHGYWLLVRGYWDLATPPSYSVPSRFPF